MAEIQQTSTIDITEESLDGFEVGEILNQMFNPEDEMETKDVLPMESSTIIQFKALTAMFAEISLQFILKDSDDLKEVGQNTRSFYDLFRMWQEQVGSLIIIQNMQIEDLQLQILAKDQMRQKLLADLQNQEEINLLEIDKLKQQFKLDVSKKNVIQNMRLMLEKHQMREQFLTDLKNQKETHLLELEKLKQQSQIEITNLTTKLNKRAEYMYRYKQILDNNQIRQKLTNELKNQKQSHLLEIEQMKKRREQEFRVGCSLCLTPMTLANGISCRYASLPCGHLFDDLCIRKHLTKHQFCPQCNADASVNDIRYIYVRTLY